MFDFSQLDGKMFSAALQHKRRDHSKKSNIDSEFFFFFWKKDVHLCIQLFGFLSIPSCSYYRLEWLQVQLYSDEHRSRQAQTSPPGRLRAKTSCVPPFTVWLWLNTVHTGFVGHVDLGTRRNAVTCVGTRATPVIFTGRLINRSIWSTIGQLYTLFTHVVFFFFFVGEMHRVCRECRDRKYRSAVTN